MIEFFCPMVPPTATAQMKQVRVHKGRPIHYDPPAVAEMKAKLKAAVAPYRPPEPLEGPVRLTTKWIWPGEEYRYKTTKPDTDNMIKALKDVMERVGFYRNDCQVVSEITEKMHGPVSGIYVKVEAL